MHLNADEMAQKITHLESFQTADFGGVRKYLSSEDSETQNTL